MKKGNKQIKYEFDATGKAIGRLASAIAIAVQGKKISTYSPEKNPNILVVVKNIDKIIFTGKKLKEKIYHHYSGYWGGLKTKKLSDLFITNPEKLLLRVVKTMLPKNKLNSHLIKKIQFKRD